MSDVISPIHSNVLVHGTLVNKSQVSETMFSIFRSWCDFYCSEPLSFKFIIKPSFFSASEELFRELFVPISNDTDMHSVFIVFIDSNQLIISPVSASK